MAERNLGARGTVLAFADPVLGGADLPGNGVKLCTGAQRRVNVSNHFDAEFLFGRKLNGPFHRIYVFGYSLCRRS